MDTVPPLTSLQQGISLLTSRRHIKVTRGNTLRVLHEMVTLWCVLMLLLAAASGSEARCSGSISRVEFTVTSVKNGTTHRNVAASLLSEVPDDSQETQPVALKVAHWTQRCGGTEMVAMDISTGTSILAESRQNTTSVKTVTSGISTVLDSTTEAEESRTTQNAGTTSIPNAVTTTSSPTPVPAPPTPLPGYQLIPGFGFYKRSTDHMTWSEGRSLCESEGARMVVLQSRKEREEVRKIFNDALIWMGVYRENPDSEFITVTGSRLATHKVRVWASGYPDRTSGDCVLAYTGWSPPFLNFDCNVPRRVVCFMSS